MQPHRLHVGLIPLPYAGCLATARVFILMQNPGFSDGDYYAEFESSAFRRAHLAMLRQENHRAEFPLVFLDPRFVFHPGAHYWLRKFSALIHQLRAGWDVPWRTALSRFARRVATLEYVPRSEE